MYKIRIQKLKNKIGKIMAAGLMIKLWFGPDNKPVLPNSIKYLLLTIVHNLTPWRTAKLISFIKLLVGQHNKIKPAKIAYLACATCLKFNPVKAVHTVSGHFNLSNRPFTFGKWILSNYLLPMGIHMYWLWSVYFPIAWEFFLIDKPQLLLCPKFF